MNLRQLAGCVALTVVGTAGAQAQGWFEECRDFSQDPPPPQYSTDYNTIGQTNGLFTAVLGVSGTSTWGGAMGPCYAPARTLDASGRLAFSMGNTGSIQSAFDNGLALSMGAPTDPVGDFCYARITKDTNDPGTSVLYGDGGMQSFFVGASKRYVSGTWSDGEVDVILTMRVLGDAAVLWWRIFNLGETARPLGLLFGIWGAQHTSFGQFDSQTGTTMFFNSLITNSGPFANKGTAEGFTGFFVTPTTKPLRNDHKFVQSSNRFPAWVQYLAGQTEAYGLHLTNVPDNSMKRISPNPLDARQKLGASTVDLIRIGAHGTTLSDNNMNVNVFGDTSGNAEEADVFIGDHSVIQRYAVQTVQPGQFRSIVQVMKTNWAVSDYNDGYAAVVDAPKLVNFDPGGQDGLDPNPMTVRAYVDNQYATIDQGITMSNVRMVITLPTGLSLAPGETAEKNTGPVQPNQLVFQQWQIESDGNTFGELPITVSFFPNPGEDKVLSTTIRVAATPRVRIADNAQMVTFPYIFGDNSLGAILGLTPEVDFKAYKWDPGQGAYLPASIANRGEGIWIVPTNDEGFIDLNGASIPGDTPTGGQLWTLQRGWNMIGNPYNYAIPLADLVAVVDDSPQDSYTWAQLVSNGFVSAAVAHWDRGVTLDGVGSYKFTTNQSSKLEPHKAYWIYVNTFNPVHISWPGVYIPGMSNAGRSEGDSWPQTERQWRLQLAARTANGADLENYVGYVADPKKAKIMTLPKPPTSPSMAVEMVLENAGNFGRAAQVVTDKKAKVEQRLFVTNKNAGDVTVTWPNLGSLPRNVRAKITDVATGEVRDLRASSGYTYFMNNAGTREFKLTLEQSGSTKPVIGNVIVSQPSRATGDATMTISYALSADALVSVRVLSGSGKEVFTVTRGRADNAGENQVVWGLRDNANRSVAPGSYKVEILAETPGGERVRRVVPVNVVR